jgi:hypothetical protein
MPDRLASVGTEPAATRRSERSSTSKTEPESIDDDEG